MENGRAMDRLKLEAEYYGIKYEDARLNMQTDGEWMAQLAGHEFDEAWLNKINELVGIGSPKMYKVHKYEHDIDDEVLRARTEFFEDVLGWADEEHPLHESYRRLTKGSQTLVRLASFIGAQRVYASRGIDVVSIARINERMLFGATEESARDKIEHLESLGLNPKAVYEGSVKTPTISKKRMSKVYNAIESFEGLDPQKILNETPSVFITSVTHLKRKIRYLQSCGVTADMINKNPKVLDLSVEHMRRNIRLLEKNGLNVPLLVDRNRWVLGSSTELLESRLKAIADMGLDVVRVLHANATLINSDPALIRSKLLLVKSILRYFNSSANVEDVANNQAMILTRNKKRLRATARIVKDAVDPEYMSTYGAEHFDFFAMKSLDAHIAAIAEKRTSSEGADSERVSITEIRRKDRQIPSKERRGHSLDLLADSRTRAAIGSRTIESYLDYQPLTEKELANYPELQELS